MRQGIKLGVVSLLVLSGFLGGCQHSKSTKSASSASSSSVKKQSSQTKSTKTAANQPPKSAATTLLKNATTKLPEDISTRTNDGEITYSQFYYQSGNWHWRLSSKKRGVIAEGTVGSVQKQPQADHYQLNMKNSEGTKYDLTFNWNNSAQSSYTVSTSYQSINGTFASGAGEAENTWHDGVPSQLEGTWITSFYPNSQHDSDNGKFKRTRFYISPKTIDGNNSTYTAHHTLVSAGAGWGANNHAQYQQIGNGEYRLRCWEEDGKAVFATYTVKLANNQLTIIDSSDPTPAMTKISSKPYVAEGLGDDRAKNLTENQIITWISRHIEDITHDHHKVMYLDPHKNKQGEFVIEARKDDPKLPMYLLIGDFKVSKDGVLEFQEPGDTSDEWKPVSDDPQD